MTILSRRTVAALAALYCLLAAPGFAVPSHAAGDNSNVMRALRDGGLVIVVRHGATFPDQADSISPSARPALTSPPLRYAASLPSARGR